MSFLVSLSESDEEDSMEASLSSACLTETFLAFPFPFFAAALPFVEACFLLEVVALADLETLAAALLLLSFSKS